MGAWGIGNLENDGAQDILAEISQELFERVLKLLQSPLAAEYDEYDHDDLFVRIEMILALAQREMINDSPPPEDIEPLIALFLDRWAQYHISAGYELPEDRQKIMINSFKSLLVVCAGAESGSFEHRLDLISQKMGQNNKG